MKTYRSIKIPDKVSKGQPVTAEDHNAILDALRSIIDLALAGQVCTSSDIGVKARTAGGTLLYSKRRQVNAPEGPEGAFYAQYAITTVGETRGDTMLQCGTVTGGNGGSATVADYKVLDPDTGVGALEGKILYLQVACSATVEDGLMMPGCEITTATLTHGASVPDNHTFTVAAASGNLYLEVGRWTSSAFLPAGPAGNVLASGCIGNFSLSK